ncbi:hypothetical protein ACFL4J_00105 [Candidatus Margulisiibacteriota bacterium]
MVLEICGKIYRIIDKSGSQWQNTPMKLAPRLLPLLCLAVLLTGCSQPASQTYSNRTFGFQVTYPDKYEAKEYVWEGVQQSVELKCDQGYINIRAMGAGTMYDEMPFDDYAKIAASVEIQNYEKEISIVTFESQSGVNGYETYWRVLQTIPPEDFDKPELYPPTIEGPIYYFPPKEKKYIARQPVKVVMLSHYARPGAEDVIVEDLAKIARSFKYL